MSYAYNEDLTMHNSIKGALAGLNSPAKTVMISEVGEEADTAGQGHNVADVSTLNEAGSAPDATGFQSYSPVSWGASTSNGALMSTGYSGGPNRIGHYDGIYFDSEHGRHTNGSNYLLTDGHVKYLTGHQVSTGLLPDFCPQTSTNVEGVPCVANPAGTESPENWVATYSPY